MAGASKLMYQVDTFKENPNPEESRLETWQVNIVGDFIFIAKDPFFH